MYRLPVLFLLLLFGFFLPANGLGQNGTVFGSVRGLTGDTLAYSNLALIGSGLQATADEKGRFFMEEVPPGTYILRATYLGFLPWSDSIDVGPGQKVRIDIRMRATSSLLDQVVVTGTMKEVNRLESPVPVEVYNPVFFKKNPTPNVYEALQNVNGVRPQLNCQVCNTGDIHINGLEGPYTMVLIDGMPIVSSLATVYGLMGIPSAMIERVEIVKGPASSLYGSEAIGGLINIITKDPAQAPVLTVDLMGTTWEEYNLDLGLKIPLGERSSVLTGVNYFQFDNLVDKNGDNFTDVTIQERFSVFQKWNFHRPGNRLFSLAARYYWEDRWGGELAWTQADRGSDQVYGEAITTNRFELLGQYALPAVDGMLFSFSLNTHDQNSTYGDMPYLGDQRIAFGQLTWDRKIGKHDLLMGTALRYTYYDDNTPATANGEGNQPDHAWLPGLFVQDEIGLSTRHKVLLGLRYDYNDAHGSILTPRLAWKWSVTDRDILRLNAGTGFRVVNLFTEDHAALTGAREVIIAEDLRPERSYNVNLNYTRKVYMNNGGFAGFDLSAWYTYFTNAIFPDYETNANQIIYGNLDGFAESKGLSANADLSLPAGLSFVLGATLMDVSVEEGGMRERQILTERFSGTWSVSYRFGGRERHDWLIDYTGNLFSPMRLPLLGELDPRPGRSPWFSLQNLQLTYRGFAGFECYGGVKNLLNWTPWKNLDEPLIARAFDPFDRGVEYDGEGQVVATPENPYGQTFDPSYMYAPNQGIRGFLGIRYQLR